MRKVAAARQKGQVLILTALGLVVLVGSIGLAVDSGIGYMSRAKLNAALDSAAIAGARAVSHGDDQGTEAASAKQAAIDFFNANYPNGYLGSTPTLNDPVITFSKEGQVTVDVSAQASRAVSLMQVLGFNQMTVGAASATIRKDLDLAFVMDTSSSMNRDAKVPPLVRAGAVSFVEQLVPTTDRVALIHFATGGVVDDKINLVQRGFDRATMETHIKSLDFDNRDTNGGGDTNYAEGMWNALNQLNSIAVPNRSTMRVIVLFSDGQPNTFASYFPFKKDPGSCGGLPVDPANNKAIDGGIAATDPSPGAKPQGLFHYDQQNMQTAGSCWPNMGQAIASAISNLPNFYNAHNPTDQQFAVVTNTYRKVTSAPNAQNVNVASRNLPEFMADQAKSAGIYIFTLGLGSDLKLKFTPPDGTGINNGEDLLKCMANVAQSNPPDSLPSRCHDATKPVGFYCYAKTADDLKPCYAELVAELLRITK
ncbi:MAG: TadE/TadG family protein [Rhodocyclaceae bacterium]|nr:TadE/TadG family protein [Rhodocyclaceae bacterium]